MNCDDGTCFVLDYRCDGGGDCRGSEDEKNCNIVEYTDNYVKDIPPGMGSDIILSMTVLDVTDVEELSGIVKAHLKISLMWTDYRSIVDSFCNYRRSIYQYICLFINICRAKILIL